MRDTYNFNLSIPITELDDRADLSNNILNDIYINTFRALSVAVGRERNIILQSSRCGERREQYKHSLQLTPL